MISFKKLAFSAQLCVLMCFAGVVAGDTADAVRTDGERPLSSSMCAFGDAKSGGDTNQPLKVSETTYGRRVTSAGAEDLKWIIMSSGTVLGELEGHNLSATIGQTIIGAGSSASYTLELGYWALDLSGSTCVAGDADGSGEVNIDDAVYVIAFIFSGGPPPVPELCCGDADASGDIDIDDVVYLIAFIFSGGPPPLDAC